MRKILKQNEFKVFYLIIFFEKPLMQYVEQFWSSILLVAWGLTRTLKVWSKTGPMTSLMEWAYSEATVIVEWLPATSAHDIHLEHTHYYVYI